jgi:peptide chain release factor subunit 3
MGHVDCGKSTTCGNIMVLTNAVDKTEIRKLKQEAKE